MSHHDSIVHNGCGWSQEVVRRIDLAHGIMDSINRVFGIVGTCAGGRVGVATRLQAYAPPMID